MKAFNIRLQEVIVLEDSQIVALYLSRSESAISHTADKYGPRL